MNLEGGNDGAFASRYKLAFSLHGHLYLALHNPYQFAKLVYVRAVVIFPLVVSTPNYAVASEIGMLYYHINLPLC